MAAKKSRDEVFGVANKTGRSTGRAKEVWSMSEVTRRAEFFCVAAHEAVGQRRKYTGEEYYYHPIEVANMVRDAGGTDEMIAAAYLHDVVEDTSVQLHTIDMMFGPDVGDYVKFLTDVSQPEDGNRAKRKEIDRNHIASAPPEAKTIKLADMISNTASILHHDPKFAKVYMKEKQLLLNVLTEGDAGLYEKAKAIVDNYFASKQPTGE